MSASAPAGSATSRPTIDLVFEVFFLVGYLKTPLMKRPFLERNILRFLRSWMSIRAAAVRLIDGGKQRLISKQVANLRY